MGEESGLIVAAENDWEHASVDDQAADAALAAAASRITCENWLK
jgi:hypothetical protein